MTDMTLFWDKLFSYIC